MDFRYSLRWVLTLIFAACCVYSFVAGNVGFGWFYLAMAGAFFISALLARRVRRR